MQYRVLVSCDCGTEASYELDEIVSGVFCPNCQEYSIMRQSLRFYHATRKAQLEQDKFVA